MTPFTAFLVLSGLMAVVAGHQTDQTNMLLEELLSAQSESANEDKMDISDNISEKLKYQVGSSLLEKGIAMLQEVMQETLTQNRLAEQDYDDCVGK